MTLNDLLAVLSDQYFCGEDDVAIVNGKLLIGRDMIVIGELDVLRGELSKGIGIVALEDSCSEKFSEMVQ